MTPTTLVSVLPSTSYHFLLFHLWKVYFPHGPQLTLVFWGKVRGQTVWLQSLEFRKTPRQRPLLRLWVAPWPSAPASVSPLQRLPQAGGQAQSPDPDVPAGSLGQW